MNSSHFTNESSIDRTMWFLVAGIAGLLFVLFSVVGISQIESNAQTAARANQSANRPLQNADFGIE